MRPSGLTVTVTVAFFTLIALGSWQLQRRAEKLALIAQYEEGLKGFAQPFPSESLWPSTKFDDLAQRKVSLEGHFVGDSYVRLYNLLPQYENRLGGMGWDIVQPFELKDGGLVLVNRGFVPDNPVFKPMLPSGVDLKLEGIARGVEHKNWLTPENNAAKNQYYRRDPSVFATALGLTPEKVAPILVDQITPNAGSEPQAANGTMQFYNRHLEYAMTWFSLAGVLVVIFIFYRRKQRKLALPTLH